VPGKPFFSVVIPLYNKAPHVNRSIGSVLNQTFDNFELIVIDDASTDESVSEVLKFEDPRIRLLHRNEPGAGGYAARNMGIKEATAEWVAFLDADDKWKPKHLQKMFELSQLFPDCHFLCCGWKKVTSDGLAKIDNYSKQNSSKGPHQISFAEYLTFFITGIRPAWTSAVCIKKCQEAETLFPEGKVEKSGDLHAWIMYLAHTKKMARRNDQTATYYRNSINMTTKMKPNHINITYDGK
jgi:glycosyltransferase involved in cell wall biosynthesis